MITIIAAAPAISAGDTDLTGLICLVSFAVVPTQITAVLRGAAAGVGRWRLVALDRVVAATIRLAGICGLAVSGHLTPLTASLVIGLAPAVSGVCYLALGRRVDPRNGDKVDDDYRGSKLRGLFAYGIRMWGASVGAVLLSRLDQVLMTPLAGVHELGIYAVAVSIGEVPQLVQLALRQVMFSTDASQNDNERLAFVSRMLVSGSALFGLALLVVLPWGIPILFGPDFQQAVQPAAILVVGTVFTSAAAMPAAGLTARGRPGTLAVITVLSLAIALAALLVLIPTLGATGAAIATLIASVATVGGTVAAFARLTGVPATALFVPDRRDWSLLRGAIRRRGAKDWKDEDDPDEQG